MGASLEYCKKKIQEGSLGKDFFDVPDQSWEVAEELSAVQFFEADLKGERNFTYPQEVSAPEEDHVNVHFSFSSLANFNHIIYRQIDHGGSIGDTLFVVQEAIKKLLKMSHVDKKNPTYRDTTDLIYRIGDIVVISEIDEARFKGKNHSGLRASTTVLIPMEIIQIVGSKEDSEFVVSLDCETEEGELEFKENADGYLVFESRGCGIWAGADETWIPTYDQAMEYAVCLVQEAIKDPSIHEVIVYEGSDSLHHEPHSVPCGKVVFEWTNYHKGRI